MIVKFDFEISDKKNGEKILKDIVSGEFIFGSLYPDMRGRTIDYTSTVYTATSRAIEELVNKSQAAGVLEYE